ncbi:MAG: hypothetical protein KGV44_14220 [Flavobacteriaceae bacterium]|nr:hypothetical protein [Flavobacteriaceae bacterium]
MKVITIESDVFKELIERISAIENYVKQTTALFCEIDEHLELSSREIRSCLQVSKSTLYRWRQEKIIPFRYNESGRARYSFKGLVMATKSGQLTIRHTDKAEILEKLATLKEQIIQNSLWESNKKE